MSIRRQIGTALYAGVLFTVLSLVAWGSGQAFIFPSLGPSTFVLAFDRHGDFDQLSEITIAHSIGAISGFVAWTLLDPGTAITATPPPFSEGGLQLITSAIISVVLTTWGMVAFGEIHPPACATTLIVSLGLLSTPLAVTIIVISIILICSVHVLSLFSFKRIFDAVYSIQVSGKD